MSTHSIITIWGDKELRLAQYCKFDGYPAGVGVDILKVLHTVNLNTLRFNAVRLQWASPVDFENRRHLIRLGHRTEDDYPEFSSHTGGEIIRVIAERPYGMKVLRQISFAKSDMCKWGYQLDFDANVLEVYRQGKPEEGSLLPLRKVGEFSLIDLPTKDEFLRGCKG